MFGLIFQCAIPWLCVCVARVDCASGHSHERKRASTWTRISCISHRISFLALHFHHFRRFFSSFFTYLLVICDLLWCECARFFSSSSSHDYYYYYFVFIILSILFCCVQCTCVIFKSIPVARLGSSEIRSSKYAEIHVIYVIFNGFVFCCCCCAYWLHRVLLTWTTTCTGLILNSIGSLT